MEAQGLSEGSLRSSHRETHAIRRKPAPASFHDLARKLVESCSEDCIIRQRLDPERAEAALKKGTFYVMENEGRGDPGFLVFLPGKPALYVQYRRGRGPQTSTLRMRVSSAVSEGGGSILIATLDDVTHTLRLEDVWMWRGECMWATQTFSRRREKLKEFVERHWVPDARLLGGILTKVAEPVSLETFASKGVTDECNSVEFIPEASGRRRMILYMEAMERAATGPAGLKQGRAGVAAASTPAPAAPAPAPTPPQQRRARAMPVDKMPDVYDLFGEDGFPISRASVQQFALSQQIRAAVQQAPPNTGVWITARWRPEFGGYEIQGLAS